MQKLRIRNFGPITQGYPDAFFDINRFTVLIGEQGSGKSTVAKVYSTFLWLEKDIFRNDGAARDFGIDEFRNLCRNQGIDDYFTDKTELEYSGNICNFHVSSGRFGIEVKGGSYVRPKIMYIPSERNLLTVLENADRIQKLPFMLRLLQKEYHNALMASGGKVMKLPLDGFMIQFNRGTNTTRIIQGNTSLNILHASSGLQSVVPLSVVTNYLAAEIRKPHSEYMATFSNFDIDRIKNRINELVNYDRPVYERLVDVLERNYAYGNTKGVPSEDRFYIEQAMQKFINLCLATVVEEPEQNLFPASQARILEDLIRTTNTKKENSLFITTHSPYVLSYITLAAKAFELSAKGLDKKEIEKIIPCSSWLDGGSCSVYQLEGGRISRLSSYGKGLPSDDNMLNNSLGTANDKFDELLDLEESFEG